MTDKIFSSGKYKGWTQKEVAKLDPQYIIDNYEESNLVMSISNEIYRLAQINLNEALELEESDDSDLDMNEFDEDEIDD